MNVDFTHIVHTVLLLYAPAQAGDRATVYMAVRIVEDSDSQPGTARTARTHFV